MRTTLSRVIELASTSNMASFVLLGLLLVGTVTAQSQLYQQCLYLISHSILVADIRQVVEFTGSNRVEQRLVSLHMFASIRVRTTLNAL